MTDAASLFRVPTNKFQAFLRLFFSDSRWARRILGGTWLCYIASPRTDRFVVCWIWMNELTPKMKERLDVAGWEIFNKEKP